MILEVASLKLKPFHLVRLSKKLRMQGLRILRNAAYFLLRRNDVRMRVPQDTVLYKPPQAAEITESGTRGAPDRREGAESATPQTDFLLCR
jgi:hypothetical protein